MNCSICGKHIEMALIVTGFTYNDMPTWEVISEGKAAGRQIACTVMSRGCAKQLAERARAK